MISTNPSTTSLVSCSSTVSACSSASLPKPILKRSNSGATIVSSATRNHRRSTHRVHFAGLDSDEEEELRSRNGQAMRKRMNQKMVYKRQKRAREHEERKRIFDILKSNLPTVKELLLEVVHHDTSPGMLFTRALHSLLEVLGAPPGCHVLIQLEWFRRQRIEYTKRLRKDVEYLDNYLYYISSSDAFKERFVWENPFEIKKWIPSTPSPTSTVTFTVDKSIEASTRGPRRWRRFFQSIFRCVLWSVQIQQMMGDNHDTGSHKQNGVSTKHSYAQFSSHEGYHYYKPQEEWAKMKVSELDEYDGVAIPARMVVGIYA